ncbi:class I SAM-dependent methyltransferase [Chengkuizengella sediminis]|uniref:class I SAM-dependent methyltransferase n=1 Tax=Chengkuizengella sediminis TaxID=1885917 RepID=UPI001389B149|nr:class I SAM-dependent methyltransferase [Chengkuizengella sediminis]NDI36225.1 class I SAM-dependent methyltransferase [Chengkuizengella sediminis]
MKWNYYSPTFLIEKYVSSSISTYNDHKKFSYDLVRNIKPKLVVELGTQWGVSHFSFCQAVKDDKIPAKCVAVDHWKGDPHTGKYKENIYQKVKKISDIEFPKISTLMRTTFNEAVNSFEDNTIDILLIDGYHTFESVKHDYVTWFPKLSINSIVLFHDIAVKKDDFGVYKLWEMLKKHYPFIEFDHSFGLGVLFPKGCDDQFIINQQDEFKKVYEK